MKTILSILAICSLCFAQVAVKTVTSTSTTTYTNFNTRVAEIGSSSYYPLYQNSTFNVTGKLTVPANFCGTLLGNCKFVGVNGSAQDTIMFMGEWKFIPGCFDTSVTTLFNVGAVPYVYVDNFGNDNTAFQRAVNSGVKIIKTFGNKKYTTTQIILPSDIKIDLAPQCTVAQASSEGTLNGTQSIFLIKGKKNIEINGNGSAILLGYRANNSEGRMGVRIDSSQNIYVHDIICKKTDGDGIYFGTTANDTANYSKYCTIENVIVDSCRRQGISIISLKNSLIKNCKFNSIGGTDPGAGIDIEPDGDWFSVYNVHIENCTAYKCAGSGFLSHLRKFTDVTTPTKQTSFVVNGFNSIECGGNAFRITSTQSKNVKISMRDLQGIKCGQNGLHIGNVSVYSELNIDGIKLINNCTETVDSLWSFPSYLSAKNDTAKTDILIYTNPATTWDTLNGNQGLLTGNIHIKNAYIQQDTRDSLPVYIGNFNGSSGSARAYIKNVVFDGLRIKTPTNRLWNKDDYGADIKFNDVQVYKTDEWRWIPAYKTYTGNTSISNDKDYDITVNNIGASGLVTYTLPGCEADSNRIQRFSFECKNSNGIKILTTTDDRIQDKDQRLPYLISYDIGSKLSLEKVNVSTWKIVERMGIWYTNDIVLLGDSNYTASQGDANKYLSNDNNTASRVIFLPQITTSNTGIEYNFLNRVSNLAYAMKIKPNSADIIMGLSTNTGDTIQACAQGSSLKLKAKEAGVWQVVSQHNGWRDIKGTEYLVNIPSTTTAGKAKYTDSTKTPVIRDGAGKYWRIKVSVTGTITADSTGQN